MATAAEAREGLEFEEPGSEEREALDALAEAASSDAALHAWHAAVAMGVWADRDLAREEWEWMQGETSEFSDDPLPPFPLREGRESVYGEHRQEIVGAVGVVERFRTEGNSIEAEDIADHVLNAGVSVPVKESRITKAALLLALEDAGYPVTWETERLPRAELQGLVERFQIPIDPRYYEIQNVRWAVDWAIKDMKEAGIRFSKRRDGTIAGFDLSGEILLLHEDKWEIIDKATAAARVEENKKEAERIEKLKTETARARADELERRLSRLSFSPTDPSYGAGAPSHGDWGPPG